MPFAFSMDNPNSIKPKISPVEPDYDFGQAPEGKNVEHVFKIRNTGGSDLVIHQAKGSWGCTATVVSTKAIPPGGEGEIKATLSTRNVKGKVRKTITVSSNDPVNPKITLSLHGEIIREVDVAPRTINFGKLRKKQTASKDLTITIEKSENIHISSVTINNDKKFAVEPKGTEEGGVARYSVNFLGSDELGKMSSTIRIALEGAQTSIMTVPIRVQIDKDLNYIKDLYFVQRNGSYPSREVYFTTLSGTPVNILKVKDTGGLLKTSILNSKGSASVLKVEVRDSKIVPSNPMKHKLIITTDHNEEPTAEISYSIVIPQQRWMNILEIL
jgi:hypothetical protein